MKKKLGLAALLTGLSAKLGLFKIVGLIMLDDLLVMKLGQNGITLANLLIAFGIGLLIWFLFEKK